MNIYMTAAILTIVAAGTHKLISTDNKKLKAVKPILYLKEFFKGSTKFGAVLLVVKYALIVLVLGGFGAISTYLAMSVAKHLSMINVKIVPYVTPFLVAMGNWKDNLQSLITLIKTQGKEKIESVANAEVLKEEKPTEHENSQNGK